jgi:hypothetical protein
MHGALNTHSPSCPQQLTQTVTTTGTTIVGGAGKGGKGRGGGAEQGTQWAKSGYMRPARPNTSGAGSVHGDTGAGQARAVDTQQGQVTRRVQHRKAQNRSGQRVLLRVSQDCDLFQTGYLLHGSGDAGIGGVVSDGGRPAPTKGQRHYCSYTSVSRGGGGGERRREEKRGGGIHTSKLTLAFTPLPPPTPHAHARPSLVHTHNE